MKKVLIILFVISSISCKKDNKTAITNSASVQSTANFDWLLGNWQRTNEKEGRETFENWIKVNDSEYIGTGFTLQNRDTIWKEDIKLIQKKDAWSFEVTGEGEKKPTIFQLTEIVNKRFTCENELNEFPKKIRYSKNGSDLEAIISGGDMEILFNFKRISDKQILFVLEACYTKSELFSLLLIKKLNW